MRILGIIPARGGSREVPRKNLRVVGGRPLISYTIEAAKRSASLTQYVTSTDDREIAAIAEAAGSPVLMRPAELAADETPMLLVVQHAVQALEAAAGRFEGIAVLQPTSPLRTVEDIDAALGLLMQDGVDSVISVYQVGDQHPARMYRLVDERLVSYEAEPPDRRRQGLPTLYHRNGAIYACRRVLLDAGTLIGPHSSAYLMPRERSVNIDDELDLSFADFLLTRQQAAVSLRT